MARILFVDTDLRNEKLGLMYISSALKAKGHDTMLCWHEMEDVEEIIKSFKPDFLAFTLTTGPHRKLIDIARRLKNVIEQRKRLSLEKLYRSGIAPRHAVHQ